jgi:hypothetical protein
MTSRNGAVGMRRVSPILSIVMSWSIAGVAFPAWADDLNDYPTALRADYVFGCMKANGETRPALERCSCSIAMQMAWLWLRYQSKSELSPWYYSRVGDLKGRVRRIMIIALARKLVIALWRYVETGKVPTGAIILDISRDQFQTTSGCQQQPHRTYYAGCRQWIKPSSCSANASCFATSSVGKKKHFFPASELVIFRPVKPYS